MLVATVKITHNGYEGAVESYIGPQNKLNWIQKSGVIRLTYEHAMEDAQLMLSDLKQEE
jgi:hypothetical protein